MGKATSVLNGSFRCTLLAASILSFEPMMQARAAPTPDTTPGPAHARTVNAPVRTSGRPVQAADAGETIIVTGTREIGKKARDSVAPIDIVSAKQISETGQPNLRQALGLLLPSLTLPTGGFDTGALTSVFSLRGLSPNETLVLVDGKRRHTTANLYADGGPQQGTTPVDIDMIPLAAIDHVEVLRDGASAQYGSDAVAGVVNVILKKQNHGFNAQSISGITAAKDGFQQGVYLDGGAKLGARGFMHVSGDFVHQDHTYRSAPDLRTGTKINKLQGQPEQTRESVAIKAGYNLTDDIQAYALATYAHRHAEAYQNYRLPGSLTNYPAYAAIYPRGYSPLETIDENDWEVTAGVKGILLGWNWDLSSVYGRDYDAIGLKDSANFAVARDTGRTPTTIQAQGFNDAQWSNTFDLSRAFHVSGWPHSINVAGGATYRYESYSVGTGSPDSTYGSGSDALAGTNPGNAGNYNRDVVGGYIDVATHLLKNWQLDLAGRYEHYTDVGDTETGKVSTRYDAFKWLAFRATLSNGFHAPTLAQEHYSSLTISPTAARGLIAANSPGALANGAAQLKPERSTNATGGIIIEPVKNLHVTVDVYQINLRDQILPGGNIIGNPARSALALNGFTLPDGSDNWADASLSANWFANVASTRTQGLDLTATYPTRLGNVGTINWDVAINLNRTRLSHQADGTTGRPLLSAQSIAYLTTAYPRSKIIFGGRFTNGAWTVGVHEIRYGQTTSELTYYTGAANTGALSNSVFLPFRNTPKFITNLDITYRANRNWSFTLGADNIFDARPSRVPDKNRYLGVPQYYMSTSQLDMNGGYYYLRANLTL
ncbi:TonB-dependent receptor [Gluconacetobacter azotocaptans]|nr:TonB-dependent receptor [Gluconacetobacter azotocaptans]